MDNLIVIILSIIGIVIALYLGITRARHKKVACLIDGSGCNKVLDSKWSNIFGIRNEWLGILYYISIIIGITFVSQYFNIYLAIKIAATLSLLYSMVLTFIQARILKHYCLYCLCTSLVNLALFIILVL